MLLPMVVLAVAGIALFVAAPLLSRVFMGRNRDTVALTRILQVVGVAMLIGALFLRPHNPETSAIPPHPDAPQDSPGP